MTDREILKNMLEKIGNDIDEFDNCFDDDNSSTRYEFDLDGELIRTYHI